MPGSDNGLAATMAAFDRLRAKPREAVAPLLVQAAEDLAAAQKAVAPKDTGALANSITVTPPGGTTPPYSQPGGSRTAGPTEAIVTAGNSEVRYPHILEFGSVKMAPEPYFFTTYRLLRDRLRRTIGRGAKKIARDAWSGE